MECDFSLFPGVLFPTSCALLPAGVDCCRPGACHRSAGVPSVEGIWVLFIRPQMEEKCSETKWSNTSQMFPLDAKPFHPLHSFHKLPERQDHQLTYLAAQHFPESFFLLSQSCRTLLPFPLNWASHVSVWEVIGGRKEKPYKGAQLNIMFFRKGWPGERRKAVASHN